jgi:uncharacterized protein YndB with AHSA1/START domain
MRERSPKGGERRPASGTHVGLCRGGQTEQNGRYVSETRQSSEGAVGPTIDVAARGGTAVRFSISVGVDVEHAFRVFTEHMSAWWPSDHHINAAPMAAAILEPRVGGRWYELGTDGSECEWGVVLAWDPPHHVAVSWHLDGDFRYDPAVDRSSRVDVRFHAQPDGTTRVELEHSGLDHHGPSWRRLRDAIATPDGWPLHLHRYALAVRG